MGWGASQRPEYSRVVVEVSRPKKLGLDTSQTGTLGAVGGGVAVHLGEGETVVGGMLDARAAAHLTFARLGAGIAIIKDDEPNPGFMFTGDAGVMLPLEMVVPYVVARGGFGGYRKGETLGIFGVAGGVDLITPSCFTFTFEGYWGPYIPTGNMMPSVGFNFRVGFMTLD